MSGASRFDKLTTSGTWPTMSVVAFAALTGLVDDK